MTVSFDCLLWWRLALHCFEFSCQQLMVPASCDKAADHDSKCNNTHAYQHVAPANPQAMLTQTMPCQSLCTGPSQVAVEECGLQIARERRLRKASEQAAEAAADGVDAERQRQAARAAQEAAFLHLKVHSLQLSVNTQPAPSTAITTR